MSAFKDALAKDTEMIFLNGDEFAEIVDIDGVECFAVRSERAGFDAGNYAPELPGRTVVLHVRTIDVAADLDMGGSCHINGKLHTVASRRDTQGGMTRLELQRNGY